MKIIFSMLLFLNSETSIYSQKIKISGNVRFGKNNTPISGANVIVKDINTSTFTNFDGNYEIIAHKGDKLIFKYLRLETKIVTVTNKNTINIKLRPDIVPLEETIIGYGEQRKKELTGAVTVLDYKSIEKLKPPRIEQALQGQASGLNITSSSGSPGSGANIRIRGVSTNGENRPLILVDGNIIEDLSVINPNYIKSINILKDATARIYGVRASNGVILIVTKSVRKNTDLCFELDTYSGFQQTTKKLSLLKPRDYAIYINEAAERWGQNPGYY